MTHQRIFPGRNQMLLLHAMYPASSLVDLTSVAAEALLKPQMGDTPDKVVISLMQPIHQTISATADKMARREGLLGDIHLEISKMALWSHKGDLSLASICPAFRFFFNSSRPSPTTLYACTYLSRLGLLWTSISLLCALRLTRKLRHHRQCPALGDSAWIHPLKICFDMALYRTIPTVLNSL